MIGVERLRLRIRRPRNHLYRRPPVIFGGGMALKVVAHTRAWLARMQTTDGKFRVHDDVYLGKEYRILPATIHMHPWTDDATGEVVERLSVMMEAEEDRGWFPVELLDIEVS
jgi:ribosomal protein L25 (general stress protein Ctc)